MTRTIPLLLSTRGPATAASCRAARWAAPLLVWAGLGLVAPAQAATSPCTPLLDRSFARLQDEKPQTLCQYSGQVIVVVNTASFCGYTPQYQGLEALNERYRKRGLVVLGFPTNDFGAQEPGSNQDIAAFCENTFGVKFPMFAKTSVKGAAGNPLFAELARLTGKAPRWNFHKYLIGRDGRTVASYGSDVDPLDRGLVRDIENYWIQNETDRLYLRPISSIHES